MAVLAILWRPFFPPATIGLAALVLAALALLAFWRARRLAPVSATAALVMRLALIAALATLLLGPSILPPASAAPGRPTLTFVVDTTGSMQTDDADGRARYDFVTARWLSDQRLAAWRRHYDVRLLALGESIQPLPDGALRQPADEVATAEVSNVIGGVAAAVADLPATPDGAPPGAVVLLSDGRDTSSAAGGGVNAPGDGVSESASGGGGGGASMAVLSGGTVPVHTVTLGGPTLQRDLALVAVPLQDYLLVDEPGQIAVRIVASGITPGGASAATTLRLRGPGVDETFPVAFDAGSVVRLTLPVVHDEPGQYAYEVEVAALSDEVELRNNRQPVFIEVTEERLRVLLLEGAPYWDTRFLAQSLRKDDRIALTQIVQVSPQKQQKIVSRVDASTEATSGGEQKRGVAVPRTADEFAAFDAVVLGAGMEHVLDPPAAAALRRYVTDHGGRLVLARGRPYDPGTPVGGLLAEALGPIEPVVWGDGAVQDVSLRFTASGASHPAFAFAPTVEDRHRILAAAPPLSAAPAIEREKAGAQVLATATSRAPGQQQPGIVTMQVGRGAVLAVLGEGLWRWSLAGRDPNASRLLAQAFDRFWSNSVRWLVMGGDFQPGRELALRLSRRSVQLGESVTIEISDRSLTPRTVTAELVGPDGERHALALTEPRTGGRYHATYRPRREGVYCVIARAEGDEPLGARFNTYELDLERLDTSADPYLMRMLAEASGGATLAPYHPEALDDLLRRQRESRVVPPRPEYAWDEAWLMFTLLGWVGCEWLLRKGGGLL